MKRALARSLCTIGLAGFGMSASASPIYFDFVATVTATMGSFSNRGLEGNIITGGFVFESDNLTQFANPDFTSMVYDDRNPVPGFAHLNVGGFSAAFPIFSEDNEVAMAFRDFCDGDLCREPYYVDALELYAGSSTLPIETWAAPGFVGSFQKFTLSMTALGDDFLSWANATPEDIVSLALPDTYRGSPAMGGGYTDRTYNCTDGAFCSVPIDNEIGFTIESVTRRVGPRAVPEPGTLGLMAFAFAGLLVFRRRAPAR
jgi:hypothetical protein